MIIKDIYIRNFRSYYGENHFELSEGLTLLVGGNGGGKTTFFEALEWLFDTRGLFDMQEEHISGMRKSELKIGESDSVSVSMVFEHYGLKELSKSFVFERVGENSIEMKQLQFDGYENIGAARKNIGGNEMLNQCFDHVIRKYCLFKGESELNVFEKDESSLQTLVENFSNFKKFEKYIAAATYIEKTANNIATTELKNDSKVSAKANKLDAEIKDYNHKIEGAEAEYKEKKGALSDYNLKLENLEKYDKIATKFNDIKKELQKLESRRVALRVAIDCDYNTRLLDDYWILRPFNTVLQEFQDKVSSLSKEKRTLEQEEIKRRAKLEGEKSAIDKIQKLANNAVPLPWNLPDAKTMQEMIDDEVCKVCGRPAPQGSEAYEFMKNKLNEYLEHTKAVSEKQIKEVEENPLFVNSYIDELQKISIRKSGETEKEINQIATNIKDELSRNKFRKKDLEKVEGEIKELENEQSNLIDSVPGLSVELLEKNFTDLRGFFQKKNEAEQRIKELEPILAEYREQKKVCEDELSQLDPNSRMSQLYVRVHLATKQILRAFINARDKNVDMFLEMLEEQANYYLKILNENDFYGIIKIRKTINNSARIELYSENGEEITNPNGALKTTISMSVLFAVARITTLKREQNYPLIFDAPTSSFEDTKESTFYNVISDIDKQCIIATKDLLIKNENNPNESILDMDTVNKLSCTVYHISKAPGFNEKDISTIRIITKKIK